MKLTSDTVSKLLGDPFDTSETLPNSVEQQKILLAEYGFSIKSIEVVWPKLIQLTAKSKNKSKDEIARKKFLFLFIKELSALNLRKDLGLALLYDFVKAIHVKASMFRLFLNERGLIKSFARVLSISPYLGGIVALRLSYLIRIFMA